MRKAVAYTPLHVTGFWKPVVSGDRLRSGSIGAGLVLSPGTTLKLRLCGRSEAVLNGESLDLRTLRILLDKWGVEACIYAWSPAPLGAGYAVSASLTLGAAAALAMITGRTLSEAYIEAHRAEIEAGTGLGDTAAIAQGGYLEVRVKPGAPGIGVVETIPLSTKLRIVTVPLGYEDTSSMLSRMPVEAYEAAQLGVEKLVSDPKLGLFLEEARRFSRLAGMMPPSLEEELEENCGNCLGFYVKKRVAVLVPRRRQVWETVSRLEALLGAKPIVFEPSQGRVTVFSLE